MPIKSALSAVGGVVSAVAVGGGLLLAAQPASAAEFATEPATVQAYKFNMDSQDHPFDIKSESDIFDTQVNTANGEPLTGYTGPGGRYNATTGLVYPSASSQGAVASVVSMSIDVPVIGTYGLVPNYSVSAGSVKATCSTDENGEPDVSVSVVSAVPSGVPSNPPANYTIYRGGAETAEDYDIKIVYNEQTTLENGQLSVVGMKVYFDVKDTGAAGSGWVRGDASFGLLTCGKSEQEPVAITSPADGSVLDLVDAQPTITGTGEPGATVEVTVNSTTLRALVNLGTTTVDEDGNWSIETTAPLESGSHTINAEQTDQFGNVTTDTSTVVVADSDEVPAIDLGALVGAVVGR